MPEETTNEEIVRALRELIGRPDPVAFKRGQVPPPAPHFITVDDRLYIRSRGARAGAVIRVAGRYLQPGGWPQTFNFAHVPNADRSTALESFSLGEGFLLGLVVFVDAGEIRRGQCWVEIGILRGLEAAGSVRQVLLKDYVVNGDAIGWPGGALRSSVEGRGAIRSITGTNPAAGAEILETVPTNARWQLSAITVQFTTDATVADRGPGWSFDDGTTVFLNVGPLLVQAASTTRQYNLSAIPLTASMQGAGTPVALPPRLVLSDGYRINTITISIQAGDDWNTPQLMVEEWIEE